MLRLFREAPDHISLLESVSRIIQLLTSPDTVCDAHSTAEREKTKESVSAHCVLRVNSCRPVVDCVSSCRWQICAASGYMTIGGSASEECLIISPLLAPLLPLLPPRHSLAGRCDFRYQSRDIRLQQTPGHVQGRRLGRCQPPASRTSGLALGGNALKTTTRQNRPLQKQTTKQSKARQNRPQQDKNKPQHQSNDAKQSCTSALILTDHCLLPALSSFFLLVSLFPCRLLWAVPSNQTTSTTRSRRRGSLSN